MPAAFRTEIDAFTARLRLRQLDGSLACARGAADVLRALVADGRHASGRALLDDVRRWGVVMQAAKPLGECGGGRGEMRRKRRPMASDPLTRLLPHQNSPSATSSAASCT